jgi:glycosyltransferase involved in cell wall biosynthesis
MSCKVVFLTVMPSPYQQELFAQLDKDSELDIAVYYYTHQAHDRAWGDRQLADYEKVLPGKTISLLGPSAHWNPGVIRMLKTERPDLVVVSDYSAITAQMAMRFLSKRGFKWLYWGERPGMNQHGWLKHKIRKFLMKPLSQATGIIGIGELATEQYRTSCQKRVKHFFSIPYYCNTASFEARGQSHVTSSDDGSVRLLFSGQFIYRKGIDILLQAFERLTKQCPNVKLIMLGSGPNLNSELEKLEQQTLDRIELIGHVEPSSLPDYFSQADVFVLPSRHDGWGLVINEAIASGLPVVASGAVGAAYELVQDGYNGFLISELSVDNLTNKLITIVTDGDLRQTMAKNTQSVLPNIQLQEGANRWKEVCKRLIHV